MASEILPEVLARFVFGHGYPPFLQLLHESCEQFVLVLLQNRMTICPILVLVLIRTGATIDINIQVEHVGCEGSNGVPLVGTCIVPLCTIRPCRDRVITKRCMPNTQSNKELGQPYALSLRNYKFNSTHNYDLVSKACTEYRYVLLTTTNVVALLRPNDLSLSLNVTLRKNTSKWTSALLPQNICEGYLSDFPL